MTFATAVSVVYLSIVAAIIYWRWPTITSLDLTEWGTFLGGAFSPLALFWLVVGYYQQQAELQQNTQALLLQREELEEQVRELRRHGDINEKQFQLIERQHTLAVQPRFRFSVRESGHFEESDILYVLFDARVVNLGSRATNILISPVDAEVIIKPVIIDSMDHEDIVDMELNIPSETYTDTFTFKMQIQFHDASNVAQIHEFLFDGEEIKEVTGVVTFNTIR